MDELNELVIEHGVERLEIYESRVTGDIWFTAISDDGTEGCIALTDGEIEHVIAFLQEILVSR